MRGSVIGAAAFLFSLAPAGADGEKRPDYFPRGEETCFGRTYDAAHLRAHPQQTVTSFHLWHELTPDPLREFEDETADAKRAFDRNPDNRLYLTLFLRRTNRPGMETQSFECSSADGKKMSCVMDCDGGTFTARREDRGSLLVTNDGFQLEGTCDRGLDYLEPGADDKVFRLDPLPAAACLAERDAGRPSLSEGGPPLRETLDGDGAACYQRSYAAAEMTRGQTVSDIWLTKDGVDFAIGIRQSDGSRSEAKVACGPNSYSWSCFNPNNRDTEYFGPDKSHALPSPAATLVRAGAGSLKLFNHRNNLAGLLGLKLGAGDDVFRMSRTDATTCGK